MDPYIEQSKLWVDFHNNLASEIQAVLNRRIRPNYFARLTPYTTYEAVEVAQSRVHGIRPDVGVMQRPLQPPQPAGGVALLDPPPVTSTVTMDEPLELLSVEIRRSDSELLVTAIEILSPVNKQPSHEAYTDYLRKRRDLLRSAVHLIEIDLLRGGIRPPLEQPVPVAPYYITLCHADRRPYVDVWPLALHARLPVIGVPLSYPDPATPLDLGNVVAAVYERGGYDAQIDYRAPVPLPPLTVDEARWVAELLEPYR
jgi:hypothetical protein